MSDDIDFVIEARIDPRESDAMAFACRQLAECLTRASQPTRVYRIGLAVVPPKTDARSPVRPAVVVLSMLAELENNNPIDVLSAGWRASIAALQATGSTVCLMNIFRHAGPRSGDGIPTALHERIQRLNRLAVDLSHDTGVLVIDVDRVLSDVGARALACDHRLGSQEGNSLAAYAIVACLMSMGLDDAIDASLLERANAQHALMNHPARRVR